MLWANGSDKHIWLFFLFCFVICACDDLMVTFLFYCYGHFRSIHNRFHLTTRKDNVGFDVIGFDKIVFF